MISISGGAELYAEARVDMDLSVVVDPRHAELDLTLRLAKAFQQRELSELLLICLDSGAKRVEHLVNCLQKLGFVGVLLFYQRQNLINIRHSDFLPDS